MFSWPIRRHGFTGGPGNTAGIGIVAGTTGPAFGRDMPATRTLMSLARIVPSRMSGRSSMPIRSRNHVVPSIPVSTRAPLTEPTLTKPTLTKDIIDSRLGGVQKPKRRSLGTVLRLQVAFQIRESLRTKRHPSQ